MYAAWRREAAKNITNAAFNRRRCCARSRAAATHAGDLRFGTRADVSHRRLRFLRRCSALWPSSALTKPDLSVVRARRSRVVSIAAKKLTTRRFLRSKSCSDVDDYCLRQSKWDDFNTRLNEQRRIFASVREEHAELASRVDAARRELVDLQHEIPAKRWFFSPFHSSLRLLFCRKRASGARAQS